MSLADIRKKIAGACKDAGRDPASVTLVAVSKGQPPEKIKNLLEQGQRVFGENRVQDAQEIWPGLRAQYPGVELHFIGRLQTNKTRDAVALFDVIQTLDGEKLAAELKKEMDKQSRPLPCFIQVNTGDEPQKGGVAPRDVEKFYRFCADLGLNVAGLMCIPPENDIAELHFALLHKLAKTLNLTGLSMGMSADFETAVRFGATHVRVGNALFGPRVGITA